ncbi:MAG: transporter [Chlorobi bacterium]|nr:MAG: hypothetical protein UZ07_CHB004002929 [Chlorobi bacterium OLB7]MBK8912153.1 transporter [Chlorobiota bacterium]MBX7215872.1 transporter [Candidatus Kapabacteria bacterium]
MAQKPLSILGLLMVASATTFSQEMATDRPDQTESSWVIPKGFLQIETGLSIGRHTPPQISGQAALTLQNLNLASTLVRVGVLERLELRLEGGYRVERSEATQSVGPIEESVVESLEGMDAVAVGVKVGIAEEDGPLPETSLILHTTLPVGDSPFGPSYVLPDFRFTLSHSLGKSLSLGYNIGAEWGDAGNPPDGIYTLVVGSDLAETIGGFVELFGTLSPGGPPQHTLDGGLTWAASDDVQLDASAGIGLTESVEDFFASAGVSFRLSAW